MGSYTVEVGPDTQATPFVTTGSTTATTVTSPTPIPVQLSKVSEAGPYLYDEGSYIDVAYPNSTVTDDAVTCPDVDQFQCLVTGQGTASGATAAVNVLSGSSWSSGDLPASAAIQKIESSTCTTAACVGVGFGAATHAAAVVDDPAHVGSWKVSSPPLTLGVTILRDVECPAPTACLALGTTATGPVILGATVVTAGTGALSLTWATDALPTGATLAASSGLTCAGSTACFVAGTTRSGTAVLLAGTATGAAQTFAAETLQTALASITDLTCAGTTACLLDGASTAGGPAVLAGAVASTPETWVAETLPVLPAGTGLKGITCVGTKACLVIGDTTTPTAATPSVLAGPVTATPASWKAQTLKATTMRSADLLACGSSACVVGGTDGTHDGVFAGPAATGTAAWVDDTVPGGLNLTQLTCTSTTSCAAVGTDTATQVGVLLTGTASPTPSAFKRASFPAITTTKTTSDVTGGGAGRTAHLASDVRPLGSPAQPGSASDPKPAMETYYHAPKITWLTPLTGPVTGGTTVTIRVSYFTLSLHEATVTFGGSAATTVSVTKTRSKITVTTPPHAAGRVTVRVSVPTSSGSQVAFAYTAFTYHAPPPAVTSVAPATGPTTGGTLVTVHTAHLTLHGTSVTVTFANSSATTVAVTAAHTEVTARTPAHTAGTVNVTVSVTKRITYWPYHTTTSATLRSGYTYVKPAIKSVTPATGPSTGGTAVTIHTSHLQLGGTSVVVTFGGTAAGTVSVTAARTTVRAVTPAHAAGSVTVTVSVTTHSTSPPGTTTVSATARNAFTYRAAPPTIASVTPATGPTTGGTTVTITGSHLVGATAVRFGTSLATTYTVVNPTTITAVTPTHGAGAVGVSVTTTGGTAADATAFTFVTPRPTITGVTPGTGPTTGGTTVTVTGTHLTGVTTVDFGTTAGTSVTGESPTTLTVVTPSHRAGIVPVSVTTPGGVASMPTAFSFVTPAPAVTGVTPATGSTKGGTAVSIAGHFLTTATTVTFGGTAATTVKVVSPTRLTAVTPPHAAGLVTVAVTTPSGTASRATAFRYVTPPPTTPSFLTGVSCYKAPTLTCVAAGATEYGAVLLTGTKGSTGFTWSSHAALTPTTPATPVPGLVAPDLPISVLNTALPSSFFVGCTGAAAGPCTTAGPVFPFTDGYAVGAGNCLPELSTLPSADTIPGTKASTFGTPVTVPLGVLTIQVVDNHVPVPGARISAQVNDSHTPLCSTLTITLGTTEADGTLTVATIDQNYTISVSGSSTTATVTAKPSYAAHGHTGLVSPLSDRGAGVSRVVGRRQLDAGEEGFTLVEMAVSVALTGTLLAIVLVVFTTFAKVENSTFSSYNELNQLTPVGTSFQRLLRTAVSPATAGAAAAPIPPFGIYATGHLKATTPITATSLTFFSNTGTTNGPELVRATLTCPTQPTTACPTTTRTLPVTGHPTGVFQVTQTSPQPTTCPGLGTRPTTTQCNWTKPTRSWAPAPKKVLTVRDVFVTGTRPVFAYHLQPPLDTPAPTGYGTPASLGATPFSSCTATRCPADMVQSVTVDIEVHVIGSRNKVESQTVTYELSTVSQTYSPAVG